MNRVLFLLSLMVISSTYTKAQTGLATDQWTYIQVDSTRVKWGDFAEPNWLRAFGLDMGDLNYDGYNDIISGRYIYLNPGAKMDEAWTRIYIDFNVDLALITDVDHDEFADVIAFAFPHVFWFEAENPQATAWNAKIVNSTIPATSHVNAQGYLLADVVESGNDEILFTAADGVYMGQIPENPHLNDWEFVRVAQTEAQEGFDVADINGDGHLDIICSEIDKDDDQERPLFIYLYENPGMPTPDWKRTRIGETINEADRIRIADFNNDGIYDFAVSEERYPGPDPDAHLYVFTGEKQNDYFRWDRKVIVQQYSMNNLDIADIDNDGDVDIVTNEHKGDEHKTQLFINNGQGTFTAQTIATGIENHLGTLFSDMDNDGDFDLVGIGWDEYQYLHLWRNDAIMDETPWIRLSSADGDMPVPSNGKQQTSLLVADFTNDGLPEIMVGERSATPGLSCLYNMGNNRYEKVIVDAGITKIEAGSAFADIDQDGDMDALFGGEGASNQMWWYENPFPAREGWKRHIIKNSGGTKHHDIMAADFDFDGKTEVVFWNQARGISALFMAEIPENPASHEGEWPMRIIYDYTDDSEMQPLPGLYGYPQYPMVNEHEGLDYADIDLDGKPDIVGAGHWFKYMPDGTFQPNIIDASFQFTRTAVGQLIPGGRPEVVLTLGDGPGPMYMYYWHEWDGWNGNERGTGTWARVLLDVDIYHGHTLDVIDFNNDGIMDIFLGEMSFQGEDSHSRIMIYLGLGNGKFKRTIVDKGVGIHEGKIIDLDNDGDLDIVSKPYTWMAPRIDIYINNR